MQVEHDFRMEKKLRSMDAELHLRFSNAVFSMQHMLSHYRRLFPEYTDHSELHSLTVIDFCNRLIGDQIEKLNADEIYILLMACYLHDAGMGVSERDYEVFKESLPYDQYFEVRPNGTVAEFVRDYHNEFSGFFIRKYAQMLEIPTPEHAFCIIQIARGHRKTDMFDKEEYPEAYRLPNGNTVCLPYLTALIRLADEIDVAAERNPILLYDIELLTDELQIYHNKMARAIPELHMSQDGFLMKVDTPENEVYAGICMMCKKMQITLDLCRTVVNERTSFHITQQWVDLYRA